MWYVIQVPEGEEENVCIQCRRAFDPVHFREVFVPKYVRMKHYQKEWHQECRSLFPGYIIVDTEHPKDIERVLGVLNRIARPVCVGDEFLPIGKQEQEFIKAMMDEQHVIQMSVGNIVNGQFNIYKGPLQDKGEYLRKIDRHKRTGQIEIRLFDRIKRMEVGLEIVSKE